MIILLLINFSFAAGCYFSISPKRAQGLVCFLLLVLGCVAAVLCVLFPWVSVGVAIVATLLCALRFERWKLIPLAMLFISLLLLNLVPGALGAARLQLRYSDSFTYQGDNIYYSAVLNKEIVADSEEGDTYQSVLYERRAVAACIAKLPRGSEVLYSYLEVQQTHYLARSYNDFIQTMSPTVYLGVRLPKQGAQEIDFPVSCIMEVQ